MKVSVFVAAWLLLGAAASIEAAWTITQLTDNSMFEWWPDVSGSNVVWTAGGTEGGPYVFLYDGNAIRQLTHDGSSGGPRVSGPNVVWSGSDGISLYDGSSTRQLSSLGLNLASEEGLEISGSNVVWRGRDGNDTEILLYDGTTSRQLTNNIRYDGFPQVSGSNVVWQRGSLPGEGPPWLAGGGDVWLYDGDTTRQLTHNGSSSWPYVSGSSVVWSWLWMDDDDEIYSDIFLYDGNTTHRLTYMDNAHTARVSGLNVVWQGGDGHIFLYNGNSTRRLSNEAVPQLSVNAGLEISGSSVVWEGHDGNDSEIFLYDGNITRQLTDNTTDDIIPRISGSNVVWSGDDGDDYEVFLASTTEPRTHVFATGVNWDSGLRGGGNAANFLRAMGASANLGSAQLLVLDEHRGNAKQAFFDGLESALHGVTPGDTFVLYLSTHGGTWTSGDENDELSISAADELLALSASAVLEDDELYTWLADNAPEGWDDVNKLFIVGSCHSGGFWGGGDVGDLDRLTKAALLSSATEDTNSFYDPETGLSFFTNGIVRGLTTDRDTADANGDGVITVGELGDYAIAGAGTGEHFGRDFPIEGFDPIPGTVLPFQYNVVLGHTADWEDSAVWTAPVPEPGVFVLLASGGLCVLAQVVRRRRRMRPS